LVKKSKSPKPKVLITGVAGGLASVLVDQLAANYDLVGVDPRSMPEGREFPGEFHRIDYVQRKMIFFAITSFTLSCIWAACLSRRERARACVTT
jgi:nucleoside-diphosphate-sugar epimerase